jgi:hypothetical protein
MRKISLLIAVWSLLMVLPSRPGVAQTAFDGLWRVRIVIEAGPCVRPPGYRYPVQITNSRLIPAQQSGDTATIITGLVDSRGSVRAAVRRGDDRARGSGQLFSNAGSGTWNSETKGCSGSWTAIRQQ